MTGFVLLRVRAHRLLLAAALLTVLLATSVLATFTAFSGAIGDAALRRTLRHQAAGQATVEVQSSLSGDPAPMDRELRRVLGGAFGGLPATVRSSTRSGPYGLPLALRPAGTPRGGDPDLTLLATFDRARLVLAAGAWPALAAPGSAPVQVAVPQAAAQTLGVRPGRTLVLANRLGGPPLTVRVTGVYRPRDRTDPYWHLDPLAGRGVHTVAFTTYGPLLADPAVFASGHVAPAEMSWQATGDFRRITTARMGTVADSVRAALVAISDDQATADASAASGLPVLVDDLRRSLLVTRSTLLIGALQLVVLAGFALLLVARLLAEERAGETALLRARGASRVRVGRLAAAEALLLAIPAAIAAPLLAGPVTKLLAGTGAMARTGASLGAGASGTAWLVAAVTAAACALAVITPAVRTTGGAPVRRTRRRALPAAIGAGADLALVAVAGVAYWQLRRRASGSGALSTTASGGLGIDPVLVAAPALCLLAGTVLVLRLLPLAARLGERRASRGRGLAWALAGWQLARRPRRGASAALLLVLAVAMGVFSIGQGASWDRSQRDQADYAVGADLRVTGMTTPPFGQAGIFASVPGITAAAPATRDQILLTQERHATVLAIDTEQAATAMRMRPDLAGGRTLASLLAPLRAGAGGGGAAGSPGGGSSGGSPGGGTSGRMSGATSGRTSSAAPSGGGPSPAGPGSGASGDTAGLPLPAGARTVTFTASLTVAAGTAVPGQEADHLSAVLTDANGVDFDMVLGDLPPDGRPHPLVLDLGAAAGTAGGAPAAPLRMVRLDAVYTLPDAAQEHRLVLSSAMVTGADGTSRPLAAGKAAPWSATALFDDPSLGDLPGGKDPSVTATRAGGAALLSVTFRTGFEYIDPTAYQQPPTVTVRARPTAPPVPVPGAIVTESYLRAVGAKVGDTVRVQINGLSTAVRVIAAVKGIPGTGDTVAALDGSASVQDTGSSSGGAGSGSASDPGPDTGDTPGADGGAADKDAGTVLIDLRTMNRLLVSHNALPLQPTEWWVATRPGATAQVAAALRARTDVDTVLVRDEMAAELRGDPLGAGPQSALPAAVVAAAVLAAVGFAVSAVGAVRERAGEFAVLRALGAPRRKLARMMAAEQGVLVLISLAVGIGLGTLLTRLVTPLIVLTPSAGRPVPDLLVELPPGRLAELLAAVLVVPLLVVAATALRRNDPAAALRRQGED